VEIRTINDRVRIKMKIKYSAFRVAWLGLNDLNCYAFVVVNFIREKRIVDVEFRR
jgi:hypothetical protein